VKNEDLWRQLEAAAARHEVEWHWVKGHAGTRKTKERTSSPTRNSRDEQIVLDTETTGLNAKLGDRIIEIGCVELASRRVSERTFQVYLNPNARSTSAPPGARPDARGSGGQAEVRASRARLP
jgi:hypothetical protein